MRKITKRSAAVVTAAVVGIGGAGAAWAAWSLNSSVDASAKAGTAVPLEVSQMQIVGTLVPGSNNDVKFQVRNKNAFPVQISNITYSDVQTDNKACPATNLEQVPNAALPQASDLSLAVAGTAGDVKTITYARSLRLRANPDDACQGATFSFKVNLTVASNA